MTMEKLMEIASRSLCYLGGDTMYLYNENGTYKSISLEEFSKNSPQLEIKKVIASYPPPATSTPSPANYDDILKMAMNDMASHSSAMKYQDLLNMAMDVISDTESNKHSDEQSQSTIVLDLSNLDRETISLPPSPILPAKNLDLEIDFSGLDEQEPVAAAPEPTTAAPEPTAAAPEPTTAVTEKKCTSMFHCNGNCGNPFHTPHNILLERALHYGQTWGDLVMEWEEEEERQKKMSRRK